MHSDCFDPILGFELGGKILSDFGGRVGGVVESEVAAFAGEVASYLKPNS